MNWLCHAVKRNESYVHYWKRYARKLRFHEEYKEVYRYCMMNLAEAESNLRQVREWLRAYRRRRRSRKKITAYPSAH